MGDRTLGERVIELEAAVRSLSGIVEGLLERETRPVKTGLKIKKNGKWVDEVA